MQETEFDLVSYWQVLVARRWLFILIVAIFLAAGVAYGKTRPLPAFPHVSSVEIGESDVKSLASKTEQVYLQMVLQKHAATGKYSEERYKVLVEVPEDSNTIVLKSQGYETSTPALLAIHQGVIDLIVRDRQEQAEITKRELENQKFQVRLSLEELKSRHGQVSQKRGLLDESAKLLQRRIEATAQVVQTTQQDRTTALSTALARGSVDQSLATMLLLMDKELSDNQTRLRDFEERLFIGLVEQRASLEQEELKTIRLEKEKEQQLVDLDFKIQAVKPGTVILQPTRLLRPPAINWIRAAQLFGVIGFVVALFVVAFAEFVMKAARRRSASAGV